jgi:hypothetical protein
MQVNRRLLYAGIFVFAIGGVLVAADLGAADTATLTDTLRLWPFALVALGVSLVVRRTELGLPTGIFAAVLPGLVLGAAFAVAPRFAGDCGARGEPQNVATAEGTFDGPASVSVRGGCGSLIVRTAAGTGWQLVAASTEGRAPAVDSSTRSLTIGATAGGGWSFLDAGRDAWDLSLPMSGIDRLSVVVTAGRGQVSLPGATIGRLAVTANASDIAVDASEATISEVSAVVNVGSLSIRLPAGSDLTGSLRVGGGELRICAPPGLGLRITSKGGPRPLSVDGLPTESTWESPDYASATHRADLSVHAYFGAVQINPIGGCS